MLVVTSILLGLALLAIVLKALYKPQGANTTYGQSTGSATCSTCTGASAKCEQECMMEAATKPIEYFEDEELDRFSGRDSASYTENEVEEFAEVLHTMRQEEVKDWCRSLTLRGVNLPNQLKDEVFMLTED